MGYKYAILGSGMQGTSAAYDLARFGEADFVFMCDLSLERAIISSKKVNDLIEKDIAKPVQLDVSNKEELLNFLKDKDIDSLLSAVPYYFNPTIAAIAIESKTNMCDLGGNTDIVFQELKLNELAKLSGVTIIPDCGLMPGMGNTLAVFGIKKLDRCDEVKIWCGGLPQNPKPPLGYKLVFNITGLTNEYCGKAYILRDGKVVEIPTFDGVEDIEFPEPVGKCEAFTTTGGTSTCPWTFAGKIKSYEYKTVRYPGHYQKIKSVMDLGLLDLEPIEVKGVKVIPRDLFHAVVEPKITFPEDKDLVVLRVICKGELEGKLSKIQLDIMDFYDEVTGFTAMERTTAYPASIVLIMITQGKTEKGVIPLEKAIDPFEFITELSKRDIKLLIQ